MLIPAKVFCGTIETNVGQSAFDDLAPADERRSNLETRLPFSG